VHFRADKVIDRSVLEDKSCKLAVRVPTKDSEFPISDVVLNTACSL
jgi:hypothetical protein